MKNLYTLLPVLFVMSISLQGQNLDFYTSTPLVKTLDADGNRVLSMKEIKAAPTALPVLDIDGDGVISDKELGGPGSYAGWTRMQTPVRIIDVDGDLSFSKEEVADSATSLMRLDTNGDGTLTVEELADKRVVRLTQGGSRSMGGRQMPSAFQGMPGGMIEMMLSEILNNEKVNDPILPGEHPGAWDGYLLFSESNIAEDIQTANTTWLLDENGKPVHIWKSSRGAPEGASVYLLENGLLLRQSAPGDWLVMDDYRVGAHGILELVDWDGNIVWEYERATPGKYVLHHDMEPLPNGNILVISYEAYTHDQFEAMGWNPNNTRTSERREDVGEKGSYIWMEKLLELKPNLENGTTDVVWEWDSANHLVQDIDPDKPNFGSLTDSLDRIDINYRPINDALLHFNSIDYHPERDQIVVSSLMNSELYFIDHKSGKIVYRWGNRKVYDPEFTEESILGGQHDARWLNDLPANGGGHLTIHNNRAGSIEGAQGRTMFQLGARYSSIIEVKLPLFEKGAYKDTPAEVVWEYKADPLVSWYAPFMGGASRLPNGNTLVVNSHNKRIFEVTPDGNRVLDYQFPGIGRMFRVYKLAADHPALAKKDLTPKGNIELPTTPTVRRLSQQRQMGTINRINQQGRQAMMSGQRQGRQSVFHPHGLSVKQKEAYDAILADSQAKRMSVFRGARGDRNKMVAAMTELNEAQDKQMRALLSDSQYMQYSEWMKEQRTLRSQRGGGGRQQPGINQ